MLVYQRLFNHELHQKNRINQRIHGPPICCSVTTKWTTEVHHVKNLLIGYSNQQDIVISCVYLEYPIYGCVRKLGIPSKSPFFSKWWLTSVFFGGTLCSNKPIWIMRSYMGLSINRGSPSEHWMVYSRDNPPIQGPTKRHTGGAWSVLEEARRMYITALRPGKRWFSGDLMI